MTFLDELTEALPEGVLVTDPNSTEAYRLDRARDRGAGFPLAVLRATSTEQVQAAVRIAAKHRVPVIPRGMGTGLSGGTSAIDGSLVVSLERMQRIEIDPSTRIATVEPGALNSEVKLAAKQHGLWYPPDPSSFEISSIGGNVATNAGGLCCVKYGVTTDYVLGVKVVLADGRCIQLGGPRVKDVAGLSLTKLFVGSEGTLGIITEVMLRLIPVLPEPTTLVATFPTLSGAVQAVIEMTRATRPSMLEFMDNATINAVEDATRMGLDRAAAGMLIVQSDQQGAGSQSELEAIEAICAAQGATEIYATDDPDEGEAFVAARRMVLPAVEKLGNVLIEDVGVPVPRLADLVEGIQEIAARNDVLVIMVAHAGDGNAHPMIVFDPQDPEQMARADTAFGEIMTLAIALGGTITGEHGVGKLKQQWLGDQLGEDVLNLNLQIKALLDPLGILNPGAMFSADATRPD